MAWAIYSTPEDLQEILDGLREGGLTSQERNVIRRYVNGVLDNWQNQPLIPTAHPCYDTDGETMRTIVITEGALDTFRQRLLQLIQKYPNRAILQSYYDLLGNGWYAVPEHPPPPGYFDGMTCT